MQKTIIKVSSINWGKQVVYFNPELEFEAKYVNKIDKERLDGFWWYVDNKEFDIDAMGKSLSELIDNLKENILTQWDGIAMMDDDKLDNQSLVLKRKLIARWIHD